jgi:ribosomal protein L11 methyltransferase
MPRAAPIYIWRRWGRREWLRDNEATIQALSGGALAVIEEIDRQQLRLEACANRARAQRLLRDFGGRIEKLPRDWLAQFAKSKREPIRIGARLVIMNAGGAGARQVSWHPGACPILRIPAGAAFGTGEHATTAMSLRMLERLTRSLPAGWRMLDAGTGSGILALAAARFGAGEVVAIDNDPSAIATANANARANRISGVRFVIGDVKQTWHGRFNLITANLYSELLGRLLPQFRQSLARAGRLILSGILRPQESELIRALQTAGFRIEESRRRGKWVALVAQKRS